MHGSFAVRLYPDDDRLLVILEGSGGNFGCGSRIFVHEDDERNADIPGAVREIRPVHEGILLFGSDEELVFGDEIRQKVDRRLKKSASVVTEIENERVRPLFPEFGVGFQKFEGGLFPVNREHDMRSFGPFDHFSFYRRHGNAAPGDFFHDGSGFADAEYFEFDHRSGRTAYVVDGIGEIESFELVFSCLRNDVAVQYSCFFRRRSRENLLDRNSEFALVHYGSDTLEVAGKGFVELLRFVDVEIRTVAVTEGLDHPFDHSGFQVVTGNGIEAVIIVFQNSVRLFEAREIP